MKKNAQRSSSTYPRRRAREHSFHLINFTADSIPQSLVSCLLATRIWLAGTHVPPLLPIQPRAHFTDCFPNSSGIMLSKFYRMLGLLEKCLKFHVYSDTAAGQFVWECIVQCISGEFLVVSDNFFSVGSYNDLLVLFIILKRWWGAVFKVFNNGHNCSLLSSKHRSLIFEDL